ncbi:HD-GYP domain-containing protein [Motiliproteus sediminis]|uniref:HD-GYP domain-containing protein n=1 Tax=Motiliproteus sediminis TaxID=1468178 RepID=UPI001AEF8FBA
MNSSSKKPELRPLNASDVVVGEPLSLSVHDAEGHLLLAKGSMIRTPSQRQRLLSRDLFVYNLAVDSAAAVKPAAEGQEQRPRRVREINVFDWLDQHVAQLTKIYDDLSKTPLPETAAGLRRMSIELQRLADLHHDGLLGAVYLNPKRHSYAHTKALHVALLVNELARAQGMSKETRWSLIAAGLTHDVGMWQMQNDIQHREAPLSDEQWQQIRGHCESGIRMLRQAGVTDPVWLTAIEQHHERLNGKGYPHGLEESKITKQAKILAIADVFAAMVRTRGDREKRMPKDAMREIFMGRGEDIDSTLVQLFIKKLGMFPPGCMLRLVTGEVGIATGPGINAASPDVEVLVDRFGNPLARPLYRDTTSKECAVKEFVNAVPHPELRSLLPGLWKMLPAA